MGERDDPAETLSKNMTRFRKRLGWSQERLADEAGLHRTYVGGVERKERNPSLRSIDRIARALRVTVSDLLRPVDDH